MNALVELEQATREAAFARARLIATSRELQARVAPRRLLDDAVDGVASASAGLIEGAERTARTRPRVTMTIGITLCLLVVRKPAGRFARRLFGRRRRHRPDDERG